MTRPSKEREPRIPVLVEFRRPTAGGPGVAATMQFRQAGEAGERRDRIAKAVNKEARPVFHDAEVLHMPTLVQPAIAAARGGAGKEVLASLADAFYEVDAESPDEAISLSEELTRKLGTDVERVLPVPRVEPAIAPVSARTKPVPAPTPDLTPLQGYLGDGPDGVNAIWAWRQPGGDGAGVTVVDVEGGWRLTHEALRAIRFNQWGGTPSKDDAWVQHGTAVVATLAAPRLLTGVSGLCPGARVGMVSVFDNEQPDRDRVAQQLVSLIDQLQPGDVVLLELQRPGPRTKYEANADQKGYVPVSFWGDVHEAVSSVVRAGISVVQVAGNGGENLDDQDYEDMFNQKRKDSGAIFVGAGAPPGGAFGAPRARLDFSNFGSRLDCQAWGQLVTTAGYGDLWNPEDADRVYTSKFMGTSAAGPIVAGVVACLQGRHKQVYGVPIHPLAVRAALANIGWPQTEQQGGERIGPQPDLALLFGVFGL